MSTAPQRRLLDVRILGPLEVRVDGHVLEVPAARQRALLGALALNAGRKVGIPYLADCIWEDALPADPANQIASIVSALRGTLRRVGAPQEIITTRRPGYELDVAHGVRVDVVDFRAAQREARGFVESGDLQRALSLMEAGLRLWRGPVLSGPGSQARQPETRRLEEEYIALRESCSDIQLGLGMHEEVIAGLSAFVEEHPLLERPRAQLMRALFESGRRADALELYHSTAELLREELGVVPGGDLQHMLEVVLAESPETSRKPPVAFRASPSGGPEPGVPSLRQLPGDLPEFVGREEELETAVAHLARPEDVRAAPVAVVVGPGGTGKTTLAVHIAHRLHDVYPDGQLYVNLGGMSGNPLSPHEALGRFLRDLGVAGPAVPDSLDDRSALFRSLLAKRRILLVLDNAGDAGQLRPLLPGTGSCAVLVTSRVRLTSVPHARVLELDVLGQDQARQLFGRILGADRVSAEPEAAAALAEYCGRLPLAVHIVAAKLASKPHWSLRKAAARLADERRRLDELAHEGLEVRSSLELSHQGLEPQARRLFRLLALLEAGDFAEWVCGPLLDIPVDEAEEVLEELVDARLVDVVSPPGSDRTRYRMHDLVRLFSVECLEEGEPQAARTAALQRTAATTLALAGLAHRKVCGGDFTVIHSRSVRPPVDADIVERVAADPLAWYEADRTTITSLCVQAAEHDEDELAWDLAATSRCLFSIRFHFDDWQRTHEVSLDATRRQGNKRGEASVLLGLGDLHLTRRAYDVALPLLRRSQELFGEVGEHHGRALAQRKAACADRVQGRTAEALESWRLCLPVLEEAGDLEAQAQVLRWTAQTLLELGRADEAETSLLAAERMAASFAGRSAGQVRLARGDLALSRGDLAAADENYRRALEVTDRLGDRSGSCAALLGLGTVDVRSGRTARGRERLEKARADARAIQDPLLELEVLLSLADAWERDGEPGEARSLLTRGAELCRRIGAASRLERFTAALSALPPSRPEQRAALPARP
ncbi:AfsR/SARP family transcriptional regulator [Streptomyces roseicoloratus]|uniref:AfsR/SARP family transcriptional regulator n=1 Tax=Streptomyces roseicoloratus TaxID=2508722 RepID=UPI001009E5A8|nr:BTAD domain-containing putative transcriptional regulator [Streptomyces roseicoloratus]